ncbi:MAG: cytochrome-c oxidase, cbb3-type subunit III [Gallionellales bacterium RIFCSPLOWO2_12_FULL_59_22]|nr:MAG: cytochrome-c oxidase, cbb3-type subunit III [Gallionellales bacterium RIFCSPLOWO2_02_FULL_59_110]OGT03787.1 MAG: cytochrome-c oxidase, cbb3-type subunit III [Gallionellales bacterium RIFCSPLOWO2_02_58_13]OGT13018.1 MAG: cytochrome-c oxidase, cbb3-type subunit III [Gallionellales bacterium RIFCSPLOWO2_12_FULL_59_22]
MSEKHDQSDAQTTGHVWDDDLADLTNQPPRWWMLGLTASALFCVVYFIYYPSFPIVTLNTFTKGIGGWTAIKEMEDAQDEVEAVRGKFEAKLKGMTPAAILADSELTEYVIRSGKVLFGDNCAACHGQNGIGTHDKDGLFAPILNDDDWLFGGKIDDIHASIENGRRGIMTANKEILSAAEIDVLADAAAKGQPTSTPLFAEKGCTACHGEDGKGFQAMGSANLTDKIWRFDGSVAGIKRTITHGVNAGDPQGRVADMPSFKQAGKLSDTEMKKLAVYVYKFGGGQPDAPAAATDAKPAN